MRFIEDKVCWPELEKIWFGERIPSKVKKMKFWLANRCGVPCNLDYYCSRSVEFNMFRRQIRELLGIGGEMTFEFLPCFGMFATKRMSYEVLEFVDGDMRLWVDYWITQDYFKVRRVLFKLPRWWDE